MVSGKGIEPNPEKVEAILRMPELTCVKDIQKLMGPMEKNPAQMT